MNLIAVTSIDWETVGHWSTLAQGLFAFLTFLATVVYVAFTYHIMKWAVGQGKASIEVSELTLRRERELHTRTMRQWLRKIQRLQHNLMVWFQQYERVPPTTFTSVNGAALDQLDAIGMLLHEVIAEAPSGYEEKARMWEPRLSAARHWCEKAGVAENDEEMTRAQAESISQSQTLFDELEPVHRDVVVEVIGWDPFTDNREEFVKRMTKALENKQMSSPDRSQ